MGSATGLLKELGDFEVDLFLGDSRAERVPVSKERWSRSDAHNCHPVRSHRTYS